MEQGEFFYYLNWFLKVVLIFLAFYLLYVIVMYVWGVVKMMEPTQDVVDICNKYAEEKNDYGYCCEQHNIYVNEQIIGSSCYGLVQNQLLEASRYECGGVNCQDGG
jgi:hypothetical protein